jgi:hypothetical protein
LPKHEPYISKRTLANSKRPDYRKGKYIDRYHDNKNKKKNSWRKKMTSSRKAKNNFKKRKGRLGIGDILARRCLHKIARTSNNKKYYDVIKIISSNKFIYINNPKKIVE